MKRHREKGLKNKAFLQITVLIAATMILILGSFYTVFRQRAVREQISYSQKNLNNMGEYIGTYIEEIDSIAKDVNYNYYLQNYLASAIEQEEGQNNLSVLENMWEYEMSSQTFNDILLTRSDISSIMIFGKKGLLFHKTMDSYRNVMMDYSELPWYKKAVKNPQNAVLTGPNRHEFLAGGNEKSFSLSRVIQSWEDRSFLGVILIDLNFNKLTEICEAGTAGQRGFFYILNEDMEPLYQQKNGNKRFNLLDKKNLEALQTGMEEEKDGEFKVEADGVSYIAVKKTVVDTGLSFLNLVPLKEVTAELTDVNFIIMAAVGISLFVTLLALNKILTDIINPLKRLQRHMARVSIENMNQQVKVESDDELGKLARNFNEMLERIENLKGQVLAEQEDKRKYELQALQAQINPHFLYNTLDSIIWMAETNDSNIVPMTEALARLFRISLNKGNEEILLKKELEHVENYLIIQSMRYADKFTYEISAQPEVESCGIIKLILQPIVENCIYHGIKKKRGTGHISIEAFRQDEYLKIFVKDDGCGMSEEVCNKILSDEVEPENISGSGIGVRNVNERIRLRFGQEYGLKYSSKMGEGTTVEYTLPFIKGEKP